MNADESTRDAILARRHFASIKQILNELLLNDDAASIDQSLQKIASQFCSGKTIFSLHC